MIQNNNKENINIWEVLYINFLDLYTRQNLYHCQKISDIFKTNSFFSLFYNEHNDKPELYIVIFAKNLHPIPFFIIQRSYRYIFSDRQR